MRYTLKIPSSSTLVQFMEILTFCPKKFCIFIIDLVFCKKFYFQKLHSIYKNASAMESCYIKFTYKLKSRNSSTYQTYLTQIDRTYIIDQRNSRFLWYFVLSDLVWKLWVRQKTYQSFWWNRFIHQLLF